MAGKIAIFWPGDYRAKPNELALPNVTQATEQLEKALDKLGRQSYRIGGWLTKPHEAIEKLGPIDDPLIGVCVHWFYGPHTTDGVVGKDNPLLLASNFSGEWPGLVGLLNTGACLESVGRKFSRVWTSAADWTADETFMARLEEWCTTGCIDYPEDEIRYGVPVALEAARTAQQVYDGIKRRRVLALMLGDTSMGMINGYFGPRLLNPIGFAEHKVDQAWIIDRGRRINDKRIDAALAFVKEKGVTFHWGEEDAEDFDENATREQLRDYLAVLDMIREFKADCLGWQYQLGLLPLRPPSDFSEGLLNSVCRPESNGDTIVCATEADQGNLVPMELMKRLLKAKGLHQAVMFHDVRWGGEHDGRFLWVLLNSGSCGAYAFSHKPDTLEGVYSYRQPAGYFPVPGGTFAGESLPGKVTWARAWIKAAEAPRASARAASELWMDIGRGEVIKLPPDKRDAWWKGTTEQWPFMATDLGITQQALMAHYMSNHIAVAYGDIFDEMVALSHALGFKVRVWGQT
ncbi:MAG TPA: fucose isomerase [Phycisphaerae bacterium]|nr:fucose isomerase [Phycisphaerae bacterium]